MDRKQELLRLLDGIKDKCVIVEGIKDKMALAKFGIRNVMMLSRVPLYKVVENIAKKYKECVILTDLDKKGKILYAKLNSKLPQMGVYVDNKLRHFLFRHTKLRQIEGLVRHIDKL